MISIISDEGSLTAACILSNFVGTQREISGILQQIIAFFGIFFHCILNETCNTCIQGVSS